MTTLNQLNSVNRQLTSYATYTGAISICHIEDSITVNILASGNVSVVIRQYATNQNIPALYNSEQSYTASPNIRKTIQVPITSPWFNVIVNNLESTSININVNTYLSLSSNGVIVQQLESLATASSTSNVIVTGSLPTGTNTIGSIECLGQNNNFEFFPTPTNNTSTIYADGTAGVNVAGGWSYSNLATGKINWYCYASAGLSTDYKVSQLNSIYTVVNNKSTLGLSLAQNPWIMIYTRPDSGTNGASWYKSKLFFGSNAHTDTLGIKLLYTGSDPVDVHPEITGINRIQLLFVESLSTKALADAQNETIMTGSLQTTNNTSQVGAFNFVMQEFGADWVKSPSILPIEFNKVQADVTGTVVVSSGAITETNSGTISSTLTSLNGKVTACNTGAVVVTTLPAITLSKTTSSITTWENPSSIISFDSGNTVRNIKSSAGSLQSLSLVNDNNSLAFVALYNSLAVDVSAGSTTPLAVIVIQKNQAIQVATHNLNFSVALSFYVATTYNGATPLTNVYVTAAYNS